MKNRRHINGYGTAVLMKADWQKLQPLSAVTRLITDEMQPVIGKIHDQIKTIEHISTNNRIEAGR